MKRYGLIGYPLGHSFSKKYFTAKFSKEHISASFENYSLESLENIRALMESEDIQGFAITIPHKRNILSYLDDRSPEVVEMNACNCVSIRQNKWYGHNTDIIGFERSFRPLLKPEHRQALILGTGGAAAAVQYVLKKLAIPFIQVSRTPGNGVLGYTDLDAEIMDAYRIIINCTPVGTFPHTDAAPPLPYAALTRHHFLYDLIYNPSETLFLKYGREKQATVKNGYEMLELQAEENWRIWNR
jgi:shikimate dehydrogenase